MCAVDELLHGHALQQAFGIAFYNALDEDLINSKLTMTTLGKGFI